MTRQEVNNMMSEIATQAGLNGYTYREYRENSAPALPYAIFYYPLSNNEGADNTTWAKIEALNIELYTEEKEFNIENIIETVLTEHGFFYDKSEQYIDSEKMYEVLYEMEVTIDG